MKDYISYLEKLCTRCTARGCCSEEEQCCDSCKWLDICPILEFYEGDQGGWCENWEQRS